MAIAEKLVEEVAKILSGNNGPTPWFVPAARKMFDNPALIKRMAEGVGFEVKEMPARYFVAQGAENYAVWERGQNIPPIQSTSRKIGDELAQKSCQQLADELNSKERGQ